MQGGAVQTEHLLHVIVACELWLSRRGRPIILSWWYPKIADNRHWAKLPEKQPNTTLIRAKWPVNQWSAP
jgi:hypothetical protein